LQDQRVRNERNKENRPRVPNLNVVVLEEVLEEYSFENFDQEGEITQNEIMESIQIDEATSSFYIFYE
jgi:hypothetical protein